MQKQKHQSQDNWNNSSTADFQINQTQIFSELSEYSSDRKQPPIKPSI